MNEEKNMIQPILKSDLKPFAASFLPLLTATHPSFLDATVTEEGDRYDVTYAYPAHFYEWANVKKQSRSNRLRALLNLGNLKELLNGRYTFILQPANLLFTHNLEPKLVIRGVKEMIPPHESYSEATFLTHYQALAIDLFHKDSVFESLINGNLAMYEGTPFETELLKATTIEEAIQIVDRHYQEEMVREERDFVQTNRKSLQAKTIWLIVSTVSVIFLAAWTVYQSFFQVPLQDRLIQANEHYLSEEYSHVVSTLEETPGSQMPRGTKYVMAYSVIQTEPLSQAQKENLLNQLSVQMNEDYLLYWTEIGKGNHDEALDIATYLDEPQITMYALSKKIEEIQNNPNLTNEERSSQMNTYQTQLDQLNENYNTEPADDTSMLPQGGGAA